MDRVHVYIGNTFIQAHRSQIVLYCPTLADQHYIDLNWLATEIQRELPDYSRKSTLQVLKSLFGMFKNRQRPGVQVGIGNIFHELFAQDSHRFGHRRGLQRSRSKFAVLAALAQTTESYELARILVGIFWAEKRTILDCERTAKLPEWAQALEALQGLGVDNEVHDCLLYLARKYDSLRYYYDHSGFYDPSTEALLELFRRLLSSMPVRGRHLHRGGWGLPAPRARTVPARYFSRPRHIALPPPEPLAIGYPSPAHSMNYLDDEVNVLKMEQDQMLDRIENLEANQEVGNAFASPLAPFQQALPWL
jgi:hypothetical protein